MRDVSEFRDFYQRHSRAVLGRARVLLGDADAAKDVMQEVFLRAMSSDPRDHDEASPAAWLYRVTTNLCLNMLRDDRRRKEILATCESSAHAGEDLEARATVVQILGRVPEDMQEVAVYYYVDEMTHDEIAGLVGTSRRTVGNRLVAFRTEMAAFARRETA